MSELHYRLAKRSELSTLMQYRMLELMRSYYDYVTDHIFFEDLHQKQYVCLLEDNAQLIQGFTTFAINPKNCGTSTYNILFSGDTIIAPEHWGSQALVRGFCHSVGQFIQTDPQKEWYWYLLSKGHRTYLYLPLFFEEYCPALTPTANEPVLQNIIQEVSSKVYAKYWQKDLGILRFDSKIGQLTPELAQATFDKANKPHIGFFLKKNPKFYEGEELVCLTRLAPENMKRLAKEVLLQSLQQSTLQHNYDKII
jgi:hypothetical protein